VFNWLRIGTVAEFYESVKDSKIYDKDRQFLRPARKRKVGLCSLIVRCQPVACNGAMNINTAASWNMAIIFLYARTVS